MSLPFHTIGHSTRSIEELVALLRVGHVELLVDIRTVPKSRTNPQFNKDTLPTNLLPFGINYLHIAELGGLRSKSKSVPSEVNGLWRNKHFHNYADYALSENFRSGLDKLITLGRRVQCAVMCSEAVWWRCHRRIVSDYLLARGEIVLHLLGHDRVESASLTQGACITSMLEVVYPTSSSSST